MDRINDAMMIDRMLEQLRDRTRRLADLQTQLSTGRRLNTASDDPAAVASTLEIRGEIDRNKQYLRNIDGISDGLSASEAAIDALQQHLGQARTIAARAASDTLSSDDRLNLGRQISEILQQAIETANSTHGGSYLFAGSQVTTPPFALDGTGTAIIFSGDRQLLTVDIAKGATIQANVVDEVPSGGGPPRITRVLTALVNLSQLLSAGSAVPSSVLDEVDQSLNGLDQLRGDVGARVNRIQTTKTQFDSVQTALTSSASQLSDADMLATTAEYQTEETAYRAALQATARVVQPSLLDYLK